MKKLKALLIVDVMKAEEFAKNSDVLETLSSVSDLVEVEIIQDEFMPQFANPLEYVGRLEKEGPEWVNASEGLLTKLADIDILMVHWAAVNRQMIDAAKKLKFIGAMRSGFEHINKQYAEDKGIVVRNCPGRLASSVADLALALILSENKGLLRRNLRDNNGEFTKESKYYDEGNRPLCMQKVGLVGFGIIAQALTRRLQACGCRISAYDPYVPTEIFAAAQVQKVDLDTLLKNSDIISMHVRLSEQTRGMIGRAEFAKMKRSAIFINTARAGLVDEEAMLEALQTGAIRGAGLDVYSHEPLDREHPLLSMDNVTLMPHIGGQFYGMLELSLSMLVAELKKWLESCPK